LLGDYESARVDLAEAEALMGRDYRLDLLTGVVLAGLGENDAAIVALSPALQTHPDCVLGLLKRAELYVAWGRHVTAIIDLTRVLDLEPNNAEVLERRGDCYDKLERYDEAVRDYSKAMSISGGHEMLAAKVAASTVNRTEQRAAREAQAAAGLEEATEDGATRRKVIEPPESPSAVLEWLQRFVEPREEDSNSNAQSRFPRSAVPSFAYR
jgi:tetratricopeptide (TPR) repeat protein